MKKLFFHLTTETVGVFTSFFGLVEERCYLVHVLSDLLTMAVINISSCVTIILFKGSITLGKIPKNPRKSQKIRENPKKSQIPYALRTSHLPLDSLTIIGILTKLNLFHREA